MQINVAFSCETVRWALPIENTKAHVGADNTCAFQDRCVDKGRYL